MWRIYLTARKEREAYFRMSDELYKSTENYTAIINSLNLYDSSVWGYQVNALLEPDEMEVIKKALYNRRDSLKKNIEYNNGVINKSKEKIKKMIEEEPELSAQIIDMVDRKERAL